MACASVRARWSGVTGEWNSARQRGQLVVAGLVAGDHLAGQVDGVEHAEGAARRGPWSRGRGAAGSEMSNRRCARRARSPRANSRKAGRTVAIGGDGATIESVMPVSTAMNGGIGVPGLTSVWNSPSTSPPRTLTAPTSVISASAGDPPVVSRSTTTKVTPGQRRAQVVERALDRRERGAPRAADCHVCDGRHWLRHWGGGSRHRLPCRGRLRPDPGPYRQHSVAMPQSAAT